MNFTKDNLYQFKFGNEQTLFSLSQLSAFGIIEEDHKCLSLNIKNFSYPTMNPRGARLQSRKTIGILECLVELNAKDFLKQFDSTKIGVYLNSFHDHLWSEYPMFEFLKAEPDLFQMFKKNYPPTAGIKYGSGIMPGHICIFLESHGPSFLASSMGISNILEIAKMDLLSKKIDCAVIGFSNVYDDPLTFYWHKEFAKNKLITECAGVFLLTDPNFKPSPAINELFNENQYYGYLNEFRSWNE